MIVTTLPLCYRRNRSFKVLFTPFVAECVVDLLGGNLVLPVNLMGIRDRVAQTEHEAVVENYGADLELLGIALPRSMIFNDMQDDFLDFVRSGVSSSIAAGRSRWESRPVAFCGCGAIELPAEILNALQAQERMKLMTHHTVSGVTCRFCGTPLETRETDVLVHDYAEDILGCQLIPRAYLNMARGIVRQIVSHPVIFSRHYRPCEGSLVLKEGTVVDPDYCWGHYLGFLKRKLDENEFVVVVGAGHLVQAYRMIVLTRDLDPSIRVSLVVHPLITIREGAEAAKKMTAREYADRCGSRAAARLFLSLGLQWNCPNSVIPLSELTLVQRGLTGRDASPAIYESRHCGLGEITVILKRDVVLKALKKLRRHVALSAEEQALVRVVCQ